MKYGINKKLVVKLKAAREKEGLSLRDAASVAKCTPQFICNIERGTANPPLPMLKSLIKAYKLSSKNVIDLIIDESRATLVKELGSKSKR